jgi:histidinol-phosphate/aromatic aminotransferase/cobyric acid decarboxylase-like protein
MTRVWIDETYVDFAGAESLERFAAESSNVIVCKSMSKAYSLSGARVGYLVGPSAMIRGLRRRCPPWSVSLPAQIAAVEALKAGTYYADRWLETGVLREALAAALRAFGWWVNPGCANFLLCEASADGPVAAEIARAGRTHGLFLREVANMGRSMGPRHLRVAVKDRATNTRMVTILADVLDQLRPDRPLVVRAPYASLAL